MKVEEIINCLETIYGDELIMSYHINAVNNAIEFLNAYQARVKELEEALELIRQAKSKLRTVEDYDDYTEMCIEGELEILVSFYEDCENPFETV
jgi:phosphopantetheine adenylyltransferase